MLTEVMIWHSHHCHLNCLPASATAGKALRAHAQAEVAHLPEILKSIPKSKIQAMQQAIRSVWQRFMWSSMPILDEIVAGLCQSNNASTAVVRNEKSEDTACMTNYHEDASSFDAFGTVMQWLASRA